MHSTDINGKCLVSEDFEFESHVVSQLDPVTLSLSVYVCVCVCTAEQKFAFNLCQLLTIINLHAYMLIG